MGFLAPWFFGALAALAVPVFVHLLRRHVTTPRPVSSLMFFERGIQSSTRHRRLKYLLLFALRAALLVLVVLAFARPFLHRAATGTRNHLMVIVLDNSFSMRAGTRFSMAKQQALSLLASKPSDTAAQIIALGGEVQILTQPITDPAQLRAAVESIQALDGHANFGDLGRTVRSLAETAHQPIDLHLFSDMQRSAMPANFADMVLPASVSLSLHSVAESTPPPNWTVESVDAPLELSDPKDIRRSHVHAVVAGFNTPAVQKNVSLIVNGKTIASRKVEVPANGRASVDFALDVAYGFNRCSVRIESNDLFPVDDAALFAVRRADPERALFVHAADDTRSATYFGSAISAAAPGSFVLQSVAAEQSTDLDPSKFAFVVLSDVVSVPSIFEHALAQYVSRGGNVLIVLGTHAARRAPIPVWGAAITDVRDYARAGGTASVSQVDFSFPALAQSQPGRDNGGWSAVKVFYASVVDPGSARVAARLSDGTPLLLDKQIGEGHALLFTSGFDNLTNDLPLHPVFVAFVDHLTRYLSGTERLTGTQLVNSFVQLRSSAEPIGGAVASVEVIDPDGRRPLSLSEARTAQTFRLARAGFYQIRFANGRDAVVGVNPDRRESNLEPLAPDILKLWSASANPATSESAAPVAAEATTRTVNLWWYVMLLAFVVALAETAVASRYMGTQREEV